MSGSHRISGVRSTLAWLLALACLPFELRADRLIYCDQTAGSVAPALLARGLPIGEGLDIIYTSDETEFTDGLSEQSWSHVVVSVRFAPAPAFLAALQAYAQSNPGSLVEIWTWHENGQTFQPGEVAEATGALTIWNHGLTVRCYRNVLNPGPQDQRVTVSTGVDWPTYEGIGLQTPVVIFHANLIDSPIALVATPTPCQERALDKYQEDAIRCHVDRSFNELQCISLYGAGGLSNPSGYVECVGQVGEAFAGCMRAALQRFEREMKICERFGVNTGNVPMP